VRIARFRADGRIRLGVVEGDQIADLGDVDGFPADVGDLLASGRLGEVADAAANAPWLALVDVELLAPIAQPPSFLAIGLNYADHVIESGMTKPAAPIVFAKQVTCVIGPNSPIEVPDEAPTLVDYEGELGIVIGTRCRRVKAADAHSVIAGYLVVNDVSVRDWQKATQTMMMGKSWDTHGPTGPWLVTADEIADPHDLRIRTWVDDELRQDASTAQMITNCYELVEHLSTAFTLLPGTIIATGTPAGVGFVMDPPRCLDPGSTVRIEIEHIGTLENRCVSTSDLAALG
jgi:2-keto-4-pentenoate hydratase/2-oxohepta-3-ene-1,7-dioic acid hydratase in catechol pathway